MMSRETYSRGTLLWVDDRFHKIDSEAIPAEIWQEMFGRQSPRLFRLMELTLDVADSYEEAVKAFDFYCSSEAAGTYVITVIDLTLPQDRSRTPEIKYGVRTAIEARRRGLPFVFLSANTNASRILERHGLGQVPYYVKEHTEGFWRLPQYLCLRVLNEFRSHISWITLDEIVSMMRSDSDLVNTYRCSENAFRYFPFFGAFRDFAERWEYKEDYFELPRLSVIRAASDHCHEFIQQCLTVMLYQPLAKHRGKVNVRYGCASDPQYMEQIFSSDVNEDASVLVVRVNPCHTSVDEFVRVLKVASNSNNVTILVLPNDESSDRYAEVLNRYHVVTIDELPELRVGSEPTREELIRRACALVFKSWKVQTTLAGRAPLPVGYLSHPELLINPISWMTLLEAQVVVEELSDPFEVVNELQQAINRIPEADRETISERLKAELPIAYENLLRVGHETLLGSEAAGALPLWIERALDSWLHLSWHFPYGLEREFAQIQQVDGHQENWRCKNWEAWEDSCYEILVPMLDELHALRSDDEPLTSRQIDLLRVRRFVGCLGGVNFLNGKPEDVDWESLESMRWPHHRYPMPSAIMRRLKQAGRYLWVQPEGVDLAASFPVGRSRYHALAGLAEHYASVLEWANRITDDLPLGWKWSVRYLVDTILEHKILEVWSNKQERQELWFALLGLLKNGSPIMLIANDMLTNKPLVGSRDSTQSYLENVHGYGKILERIRRTTARRVCGYLVPKWNTADIKHEFVSLAQRVRLFERLNEATPKGPETQFHETLSALRVLLMRLGRLDVSDHEAFGAFDREFVDTFNAFIADPELKLLSSPDQWFVKEGGMKKLRPGVPTPQLISLFATKADIVWQTVDLIALLRQVIHKYCYYDGYHFLATLNDIRVSGKDAVPNLDKQDLETVLELFVSSLEGLIAQLSWCLQMAGAKKRAKRISPPHVALKPPKDFRHPPSDELSQVMCVEDKNDGYAVFSLGIPGRKHVRSLCFHSRNEVFEAEASVIKGE